MKMKDLFYEVLERFDCDKFIKNFIEEEFCISTKYRKIDGRRCEEIEYYNVNEQYHEVYENFLADVYSFDFGQTFLDVLWDYLYDTLHDIRDYLYKNVALVDIYDLKDYSLDITNDYIGEYIADKMQDNDYIESFKKYVR